MRLTVAICTWNRAGLLDRTLAAMRDLWIPPDVSWELLVVDNNCTDSTPDVLARHASSLPLRAVTESRQGHSHARNRAVAEATGDFILWTDDDVLVDQLWLAEYVTTVKEWPDASLFGGPIEPWFESTPARWIIDNLKRIDSAFALRDFGPHVRRLEDDELPYGANMAFRTDVLRRFPFDPELGRVGTGLLGADETTVMRQMIASGHFGVWVGSARVKHFIPNSRLTKKYIWDFHRAAGYQLPTNGKATDRMLWGAPAWAYRQYWQSSALSALLSPIKNERWLRAFLASAYYRGMIDAHQQRSRGQIAQ